MSNAPDGETIESHVEHPDDLAQIEARERIEKLKLEKHKLELEGRALKRQLSSHGVALDWLKSGAVLATVLAAIVGAAVALYVGQVQSSRYEQNRRSDQFDKALARLASSNPGERMTGVAGLRLFLLGDGGALHRESLHSLINAVSYEREGRVGNAIRNVFANLKKGQVRQEVLDEALKFAVELNRSLTGDIVANWRRETEQGQKRILMEAGVNEVGSANIFSQVPLRLLQKLDSAQYLKYLAQFRGPFNDLGDERRVPLQGLSDAVVSLVALGAVTQDFSGIYCENCDFTPTALARANFDGAYLSGADFSKVDLQGASFRGAEVMGTYFYAADLRGAKLSSYAQIATLDVDEKMSFPYLACARLEGADLSGLVLLSVTKTYDMNGEQRIEFAGPNMYSARVDGSTRLDRLGVMLTSSLSDAYADKRGSDDVVTRFSRRDLQQGDALFGNNWASSVRRSSPSLIEGLEIPAHSVFMTAKSVAEDDLAGLNHDEMALLRTYVSQPSLGALPLIKQIDALKVGELPGQLLPWEAPPADNCGSKPDDETPSLVLRRYVTVASRPEPEEASSVSKPSGATSTPSP